MLLPAKRDRLSIARQALDGDVPNVAATAGPTPVGAIGGGQVLDVSRNIAETGQAQPTVVPDSYGEVTGTEIESTGDTGALINAGVDATPNENPVMIPDEPVEGETPEDFDEAAEQFNWSMLDEALQGVDTSAEEAQMQAQQDRLLGQSLMDQRAAAGASGFGESGAMMAMEGGLRSDAARQLGLDVSQLRRHEKQQAIENAFKAQGIDIEKMSAADQARLNELIASFMMNEGELPPEDGGGDGGGLLPGGIPNPIEAGGDALTNETTPFGKGTGQSETAAAPEEYPIAINGPSEGDEKIDTYTDANGDTWDVYVSSVTGNKYKVGAA